VPRQHTTGGKPGLGGIGRQANHYLRRQMIHGARSIAFRMVGRDDARSKWLQALVARRGFNRAVVGLANKTARIAWALLTRQEVYKAAREDTARSGEACEVSGDGASTQEHSLTNLIAYKA
jgi:transposase